MIIWLASYPRSGNTFFRISLNHFFGIKTYSAYKDRVLNERRLTAETVGHINKTKSLDEMAADSDIYFVKTHDLPSDELPTIYLVRDGRDVMVSYAWYILSFENENKADIAPETFRHTLHDLIVYNASFGGWGPNVLAWVKRSQTVTIRFEDMIQDPQKEVGQALAALNYTVSAPSKHMPTFEELHEQMPQFFRKGQVGSWKTEMPEALEQLFWEHHGEAMNIMGYVR